MFDPFAWSFPIGRLFGVTIRVHLFFPLVVLPLVLQASLNPGAAPGTWIDACWVGLIFSLVTMMHELGHCLMARKVGGEADEVLLWPLGGLARAGFLPQTPRATFLFAAGGPLMDLLAFVVTSLALGLMFESSIRPIFNPFGWYPFRIHEGGYALALWNGGTYQTGSLFVMLLAWINWISWFSFLFNMVLVGLPWDAGYMMRSVLWPYVGFHQATLYMISTGFMVMVILFMASLFFNLTLLFCLAMYAFYMCWHEWVMLERRGEDSLFGYDFSQGYTSLEKDQPAQAPARKKQNFLQRWQQKRQARKLLREQEQQEAEERRMDELLQKIQTHGKDSLTDEETRFLKRVSDRYRNRH